MTSPFGDALLRGIDEAVSRAMSRSPSGEVGTVVSVEPARQRAMVVFDTATTATPAKVAGGVWCELNDRVLLNRYGSDWYVVDVTNRIVGPNLAGIGMASPTGTLAAVGPVDLPGPPNFMFTKRWDTTPLVISHSAYMYCSGSVSGASGVLKFESTSLIVQYEVWKTQLANDLDHKYPHAIRTIPDATYTSALPAGQYSVTMQWGRWTGTGTLNQNSDDWNSAWVMEVGT